MVSFGKCDKSRHRIGNETIKKSGPGPRHGHTVSLIESHTSDLNVSSLYLRGITLENTADQLNSIIFSLTSERDLVKLSLEIRVKNAPQNQLVIMRMIDKRVSDSDLSMVRKNVRPSDNNAAASELAYEYQVFTMKSFADAIIIINKNRENQILDLQ
ncbi:uncharacterized protein BDCG_00011 [Blastomyces dermatitidis ER-3]|uniref:Uncharacterized protein n=1 Tax=Ajellomyces dermatitidis (strain ER-3 / ATCC MYA-2586) TaxID=559297 RepID=A0ABP2EKG0_AJEDR|nr:uncharacterized protein BDCG_00011 [Blastomyces dermatitidis ER-3]EEQ83206.2 hypothetical protein BDCG_00011 [Blastomyces dermatitidis ER-3]